MNKLFKGCGQVISLLILLLFLLGPFLLMYFVLEALNIPDTNTILYAGLYAFGIFVLEIIPLTYLIYSYGGTGLSDMQNSGYNDELGIDLALFVVLGIMTLGKYVSYIFVSKEFYLKAKGNIFASFFRAIIVSFFSTIVGGAILWLIITGYLFFNKK